MLPTTNAPMSFVQAPRACGIGGLAARCCQGSRQAFVSVHLVCLCQSTAPGPFDEPFGEQHGIAENEETLPLPSDRVNAPGNGKGQRRRRVQSAKARSLRRGLDRSSYMNCKMRNRRCHHGIIMMVQVMKFDDQKPTICAVVLYVCVKQATNPRTFNLKNRRKPKNMSKLQDTVGP